MNQVSLSAFAAALLLANSATIHAQAISPNTATATARGMALLSKEHEKKWNIVSGDWRFEDGTLTGSGASEIVYEKPFDPPITLQFSIKVLKGMRPRVRLGGITFGNQDSENTFWIYPGAKNNNLFHYKMNTVYKVSIVAASKAVELYVDGSLVTTAAAVKDKRLQSMVGVKDKAMELKFSAGDSWSRGKVEYRDIIVTRGTVRPTR